MVANIGLDLGSVLRPMGRTGPDFLKQLFGFALGPPISKLEKKKKSIYKLVVPQAISHLVGT